MRSVNDIFQDNQTAQERVGEIYQIINGEVASDADLSSLNSPSKSAIYNLWMYVFAAICWVQEKVFEDNKNEVQAIVENAIPGTDKWLAVEVGKWQNGDTLVFDVESAKYSYPIIDPAKRIIKRVAVVSNGGLTTVKVAKEDGNGNPLPLSTPELTAFKSYVNEIQWAGSNVTVVSLASDKLKLPIDVFYDGQIPVSAMQSLVEQAINSYLANLDFNGTLFETKLMDSIQVVEGVRDVVFRGLEARPNVGTFNPIERVYDAISGYNEIDSSFPLASTINYLTS